MPAQPDSTTRPCCPLVCLVPSALPQGMAGAPQPVQMFMPMMPMMAPPMMEVGMPMISAGGYPQTDNMSNMAWLANPFPGNEPFWPEHGTAGRAEMVNQTMEGVFWQPPVEQVPPQLPMEDASKTPSPQTSPPISAREAGQQMIYMVGAPFGNPNQFLYPSSSEEEEVPVQYRMEHNSIQPSPTLGATAPACMSQLHEYLHCSASATAEECAETVSGSCAGTLRRRRQKGGAPWEPAAQSLGQPGLDNEHGAGAVYEEQQEDMDAEFAVVEAEAQVLADGLLYELRAGSNDQSVLTIFERMCFQSKTSSRAAQLALQQGSAAEATQLAQGLRGHVRSAVQSKFANFVVQKITEVMPVSSASFITEELLGFGYEVARHRFGCRVFCRILEHLTSNDTARVKLVDQALADPEDLCSHAFGSFVARHALEFGLEEHKARIAAALRTDVMGYARHKLGSHVIEAALRLAAPEDRNTIMEKLLSDEDQLFSLSANQFGRHVVRSLLSQQGPQRQQVIRAIKPLEERLRSSRYGKSVVQTLRAVSA